jgi:molecular chaperone GrpE
LLDKNMKKQKVENNTNEEMLTNEPVNEVNESAESTETFVAQDETEILKSQLARALADYDNLRRRVELEKSAWVKFATQGVVGKLLPTLDMLLLSQKHVNDQGLSMAVNEFKKVLIEEDLVEIIPVAGMVFDHDQHEAVDVVEGEDGKVVEIVQSGWKFKDGNIVRPAKVKVGKKA